MINLPSRLLALPIQKSMMLVSCLPIVVSIALGVWTFLPRHNLASEHGAMNEMLKFAESAAHLVHEQQKERGATAVFLGSSGNNFRQELVTQRARTDQKRELALVHLATVSQLARDPELQAELTALFSALESLNKLRADVDALAVTHTAERLYTNLNVSLLNTIKRLSQETSDAEIAAGITSYVGFLQGKERAGLERAVGSGAFAMGRFSAEMLTRFVNLIQVQDVYYNIFLDDATGEQSREFAQVMNSRPAKTIQKMRDLAIFAGPDGDLFGISDRDFFAAQTQKIELLKRVEDILAADLLALGASKRSAAVRSEIVTLVVVAIAGAGAFAMSFMIARAVRDAMESVSIAAMAMAEGDLDTVVPEATETELGRIAGALDLFRNSIQKARAREQDMRDREKREEQRQHDVAEKARAAADTQAAEVARQDELKRDQERLAAEEISAVVAACASGDFSQRINPAGKDGVFAELCNGVNQIGAATDRSLKEINIALSAIADGDMTYRIDGDFEGVFGEMATAVNGSTESLANIVARIRDSSATIRGSTESIAATAGDLAKRTETNAAALEQTSIALSELTTSVHEAADSANDASNSAADVSAEAGRGTDLVTETVAAMQEIKDSSASIAKIIDVIDSIAFQTNLLALNAGVEAARAGDAGRGFAVVATEVRALAARSAQAAQEIADLISVSGQKVDDGVQLVDRSCKALRSIAAAVTDISSRIDKIAASTREQTTGIEEINTASVQLDSATQENAAMFEQTTASIQEMQVEFDALITALDVFQLGDEQPKTVQNTPGPSTTPDPRRCCMDQTIVASRPYP